MFLYVYVRLYDRLLRLRLVARHYITKCYEGDYRYWWGRVNDNGYLLLRTLAFEFDSLTVLNPNSYNY